MRMDATFAVTGRDVQKARKAAGLTQRQLAERAGLHLNSVKRLERRQGLVLRSSWHALGRCGIHLPALPPVEGRCPSPKPAPAIQSSADIDRPKLGQFSDANAGARQQHGVKAKPSWRPRKADRPKCGARTRKGPPCQAPARANGRCRMHGGLSTGAKTEEGLQKIREAQHRRWARYRAALAHRESSMKTVSGPDLATGFR